LAAGRSCCDRADLPRPAGPPRPPWWWRFRWSTPVCPTFAGPTDKNPPADGRPDEELPLSPPGPAGRARTVSADDQALTRWTRGW